jgi:uncharacterized protein
MSEPVSPIVNALNAPFWAAAGEGRLLLPTCVATGRAFWPPSPLSPFVGGGAVDWRASPGEGTLLSVVVYRRVFQQAFAPRVPYGVALVQLDEGPRLLAFVAKPDAADAPRVGERVAIGFAPAVEGGRSVPTLHSILA